MLKFVAANSKDMANGMRDTSGTPLSEKEIAYVEAQIERIGAERSVFVFNAPSHLHRTTCYNFDEDKIYVTRSVFPDTRYGSTHPRDLMSLATVLAHEYYGHRRHREEYLSDCEKGEDFHTTPIWQDECRASIEAAKITPNLTDTERKNLIMDAVYQANEYNQYIEMDDFMKEIIYGYPKSKEGNISDALSPIRYVSASSVDRN